MVGALRVRVDENEGVEQAGQIKKHGVLAKDATTKRAALGNLQNREVVRAVNGKEAAQKDVKFTKLQNVLRAAKPRVDTQWRKASAVAASLTSSKNVAAEATAPAAGQTAAAGQRRILTRTNSLRVGANNAGGSTMVRQGSGSFPAPVGAAAQQKVKTTTTKIVENKVQNLKLASTKVGRAAAVVESKAAEKPVVLRREDSKLSRRSLTKLKAALARDAAVTKPTAVKKEAKSRSNSASSTASSASSTSSASSKAEAATNELRIVSVQTHSSNLLDQVEDIDADDGELLCLVSNYVNDIYDYLYKLEVEHAIQPNHMEKQIEVFPKMRTVLIDWLNEVHLQFRLAVETFQMAVAIIDRYLQSVVDTKRSQLQLVGVTALFLAAKYEELFPPAIADFVYITDNTYDAKQIIQMELRIFKVLNCNLSRPLPIHFLRRYSKAVKADDSCHAMAKYFLELVSVEYEMAAYKPSEVAAASLFLVLHLLKKNADKAPGFHDKLWTPTLEWYSRYDAAHLRPIARRIAVFARNAPKAKQKAVYFKYQSSKLHRIALRSELYGSVMDSLISSKD